MLPRAGEEADDESERAITRDARDKAIRDLHEPAALGQIVRARVPRAVLRATAESRANIRR